MWVRETWIISDGPKSASIKSAIGLCLEIEYGYLLSFSVENSISYLASLDGLKIVIWFFLCTGYIRNSHP